ncbi:hypothetical protein LSH36_237g04063 [Paralvinella palmiformis]|uniref:Retrotransposon gag domain-containing protein n=1 Tax=Paralvinella palmiformis TaxID=53620 RepID=A0AAD9JLR8_9ANNE|nr:hypothetical protein LSH36_237g04063 [Paralvinella palmiformis]
MGGQWIFIGKVNVTRRLSEQYLRIVEMMIRQYEPISTDEQVLYVLESVSQKGGESIESYATELTNLTKDWNFGQPRDSLIRDQIVLGVFDHKEQDRLLREIDLTLERALETCQATTYQGVRVRDNSEWEPAVVVRPHASPRSYIIRRNVQELRRNTGHLMPIVEYPPGVIG